MLSVNNGYSLNSSTRCVVLETVGSIVIACLTRYCCLLDAPSQVRQQSRRHMVGMVYNEFQPNPVNCSGGVAWMCHLGVVANP